MFKKKWGMICVILAIIAAGSKNVYALGIGAYTTGKAGLSTLNSKDVKSSVDYALGFGLVLDTAVAKNELMNYRLGVGYENVVDSGVVFFRKWSMDRISLTNTFGFALFKNQIVRVWMGPQIDLGVQFKNVSYENLEGNIFFLYKYLYKTDKSTIFSLGFGGVFGLNINPAGLFSISLEIGLNTCLGIGTYRNRSRGVYVLNFMDWTDTGSTIPENKTGDMGFAKAEGFCRLSFLFRIADTYAAGIPRNAPIELQD